MAKEKQIGYILVCPGCGGQMDSPFQNAICTTCGNVASRVPLDGAFEDAVEGDVVKKGKAPEKKPAEKDTANRSAEDGGRSF